MALPVGPIGGEGGGAWDDNYYTGVRQIILRCGEFIDAIQVEYDNNGASKWGNLHGGNGGGSNPITLNYPSEYLVSIEGYYGSQGTDDSTVLQSITFRTNASIYGPYGTKRGVYFSFPALGKFVGFFGRSGWYLDALGVYIEPFNSNTVEAIGPVESTEPGTSVDDGVHTGEVKA